MIQQWKAQRKIRNWERRGGSSSQTTQLWISNEKLKLIEQSFEWE